jgi:hypothetical protein
MVTGPRHHGRVRDRRACWIGRIALDGATHDGHVWIGRLARGKYANLLVGLESIATACASTVQDCGGPERERIVTTRTAGHRHDLAVLVLVLEAAIPFVCEILLVRVAMTEPVT